MYDLEPFLTHDVRDAIHAHLVEDAPNEACGMITFTSGKYRYHREENIHENPLEFFRFGKAASLAINTDDDVVAYVHTHPHGPAFPSKTDMEIQRKVGKPSVICSVSGGLVEVFSFGDHLLDLPLIGRDFRYAVTDCYEAIRSWRYQVEGVKMDAFPRHDQWWSFAGAEGLKAEELNMYEQYYQTQGYVPFTVDLKNPQSEFHPKVGDLILMKMGSNMQVMNHAGIYTGNNLLYDHRLGKRSRETPLGYYLPTGVVRQWARQGDKF